jgi:phosphoserine phosphatase RsbU/P
MLPQQYPAFPTSENPRQSAFEFTHRYLPTGTVGGDFFTVSALSETEAGVFICDVAGHGVRSALVTAMIRALVEELKPSAADPGQFMNKLNRDLHAILRHAGSPLLTTAFYMVADCRNSKVRFCNAGHPKPLLVRRGAGDVTPLVNASGRSQPALGLFPEAVYETTDVAVKSNDLVMLFTDGLYEVQNAAGELYSQTMLVSSIRQRLNQPAPRLFDDLLAEITTYSQGAGFTDDVCLVGLEVE